MQKEGTVLLKKHASFYRLHLLILVSLEGWLALTYTSSVALSSSENRLRLVWHVANS